MCRGRTHLLSAGWAERGVTPAASLSLFVCRVPGPAAAAAKLCVRAAAAAAAAATHSMTLTVSVSVGHKPSFAALRQQGWAEGALPTGWNMLLFVGFAMQCDAVHSLSCLALPS